MTESAIAVDLGGTNIRAAMVGRDGRIEGVVTRGTGAGEGPEAVIDRIVALVSEVVNGAQPAPEVKVGVVAPGPLNPFTGVVYFGPNLPGWHDVPLRDILRQRLNRDVVIGNDANSAALGEVMFGAARQVRHLVYLALGTGVGGGIVSHGHLIEGIRGVGGEVGHVSIDPSGPRCHCGGIGCVEAYVGGWAIARDGEMLIRSSRSSAIETAARGSPVTAEVVAEAARAGDEAARGVFQRAGQALAVGIAGLVNIFNPELIVIGGGLAAVEGLLLDPLRESLPRYAMAQIHPDATIRRSALGGNTGLFGAAARVFYHEQTSNALLEP
ncbi:MAG TPA: ROK family protein [Thermomicrobiaceae bacterium]|nr:ROK family protein [Thermomicrobiaceae bacterium]